MNVKAAVIAETMYIEEANTDGERGANPNAKAVAIDEPVEQQAPLDYGMPHAPTGMTEGDKGKGRAGISEEQGRGRGIRMSSRRLWSRGLVVSTQCRLAVVMFMRLDSPRGVTGMTFQTGRDVTIQMGEMSLHRYPYEIPPQLRIYC